MMVDLSMSTVRPLGTGMSSNSLRCGRDGDDAQAVRVNMITETMSARRMGSTSSRPSYRGERPPTKLLRPMLVICLLAGYVSTAIPSEVDKQTLRDQADREEERLLRTGKVHEEPLLDEYLTAVTASLMPGADATPVRITVLRDVAPGAFVLPNGRLFVHTGLLARLDNEAQLAVILARQTVHLSERHALRVARDGSETAPSTAALFLVQGLRLPYLRAFTGYGRDLERDTDAQSLARAMQAGYDPREAPRAFERLRQ